MYIPTKLASKVIRIALREKCPNGFHIRMDRGTAYGWISIWAGNYWDFTEEEKKAFKEVFDREPTGNCFVISPESREYYVRKAIESSLKARRVYETEMLAEKLKRNR